jgi:hypothetical protein
MEKSDLIWQPSHEKIHLFLDNVIKQVFPHARFASSLMIGSPDVAPNSFDGVLSPENLFKDTLYEYNGSGKFIHFTTLLGLNSILNDGWLRMSEFRNLIDQNELLYASKVFSDNQLFTPQIETLNRVKDNIFCLSACEATDETKTDSYLWEVYGDKGKGVFIEYEFSDPKPYNHIFGKVRYGDLELAQLRNLKSLFEEFRNTHSDFSPGKFIELILEAQAFHKSDKYSSEKEIRMLLRVDKQQYEEHNDINIYQDINSKQEIRYFSKLFLKGRHSFLAREKIEKIGLENIIKITPQIEIKKVVLGFNILIENKVEIMYFLQKVKNLHNYEFELWHLNDEKKFIKMF